MVVAHYIQLANSFIHGDSFFYYHGLVLIICWFVAALIAILARKISILLHALLFNLIDITTSFFIIGAMIRVYPYITDRWDQWTLLKKGHFLGGGVFLIMLIIQHIGGVSTYLQGMKFNSAHRKFAVVVTNMGRFIAFFGLVIAQAPPMYIYGSGALAVILLILSVYNVFFKKSSGRKQNKQKQQQSSSRNKSPKKRD